MSIPLFDPTPDIDTHFDEYTEAIQNVMKHGQFILGPEVEEFEQRAAEYLGVEYAIGVNSGTDALVIGLRAAGVEPGDEVITTPFSFFATAESISNIGATPVFVDIDEKTFNIDPGKIEEAITEKTKAMLPVHLFGRPAEMEPIMQIAGKHDLKVIEDCAQSFGATVNGKQTGSIGDVGAFSFFPTKNLGGFGDGGLITTGSDEIADLCRKLRAHGSLRKYHNEMLGYNSRLDTIQAAVLLEKLKHIEEANLKRRKIAQTYTEALEPVPGLRTPSIPGRESTVHIFHQYTLRVLDGKRDKLREQLKDEGIGTGVYYPVPQDRLPVYAEMEYELPVSSGLANQVLSLPIYPGLGTQEVETVARTIKKVLPELQE